MLVKEKKAELGAEVVKKERMNGLTVFILSFTAGMLFSGAFGSRSSVSFCTALAAVLSPFGTMCAYMGSLTAYLLSGTAGAHTAEIAAMPILAGTQFLCMLFGGKKLGRLAAALAASGGYFLCAAAAAMFGKISAVIILAALFRGAVCGAVAYFIHGFASDFDEDGRVEISGRGALGTSVVYVLAISALSAVEFGGFNAGCIAGMFVILAAAGRYRCGGAAAVGALTSFGMILGEVQSISSSDNIRGTVIMTCAGLAACMMTKKSRLAASVCFIAAMLVLQLFAGSLTRASDFMLCTVAAAALYSFIPDRLYMKAVGSVMARQSTSAQHYRMRISCAATALDGIGKSMARANEILDGTDNTALSFSDGLCTEVCSDCRNRAFCCKGDRGRKQSVFSLVEKQLSVNGLITEKMLPKSLDHCNRRTEICDFMNAAFRRRGYELRVEDTALRMRELALEQLGTSEKILSELCGGHKSDERLSADVRDVLERCGLSEPEADVFFDKNGRIFVSCICSDISRFSAEMAADAVSALVDRELEIPEIIPCGDFYRICLCEQAVYKAETGLFTALGKDEISGDSSDIFTDGFGNLYCIISDGMGSGGLAAAESLIAVSLIKRLIRAGCGTEASVRLTNIMLLTKASRESFASLDMLVFNSFSGQTDFIKLGAAVSFLNTGGLVNELGCSSLPLGIVGTADYSRRSVRLDGGDSVVLMSDGIGEECYPSVRELIQSSALSAQMCAERIIIGSEPTSDGKTAHIDDRTVIIVKIHKIG